MLLLHIVDTFEDCDAVANTDDSHLFQLLMP